MSCLRFLGGKPLVVVTGPIGPSSAEVRLARGVVAEGMVGSDRVVNLAESLDFHGQGVAVGDLSAVEVLVFQGAEEPLVNRSASATACRKQARASRPRAVGPTVTARQYFVA